MYLLTYLLTERETYNPVAMGCGLQRGGTPANCGARATWRRWKQRTAACFSHDRLSSRRGAHITDRCSHTTADLQK